MENIIGKNIGIVEHTFSITNDATDKVQLRVKIDFSTASDVDIKSWLVSNRVIAGQRSWRALSKTELEDLQDQTFVAQHIGRKVKSREERIQELVTAGLPRKLAEFSIDNPEQFQAIVGGLETEVQEETTNDNE